ncbi:MAG: DUF1365 domain-containing protein [Pseudomonadota bacterium]
MSLAAARDPAIALYRGHTVHERRAPFLHRFRYPIASILIDLDRLDEIDAGQRLFSFERFNLFSFRQRDHGPRDGSSLAAWARARFTEAGVDVQAARIRLLCFPRVLGYVFNPLSLYLAEGREGGLRGAIYQVHNTFGEAHAYVGPAIAGPGGTCRQEAEKRFHVSPFFDRAGRYDFTLRAPSERFSLVIKKQREDGPDLLATMSMHRQALTDRSLLGLFASLPFSTLQAIFGIHWQALRLILKGARYHSKPDPLEPVSAARPVDPSPQDFSQPAE